MTVSGKRGERIESGLRRDLRGSQEPVGEDNCPEEEDARETTVTGWVEEVLTIHVRESEHGMTVAVTFGVL